MTMPLTNNGHSNQTKGSAQRCVDVAASAVWLILLSPITLCNYIVSLLAGMPLFRVVYKTDAMGRLHQLNVFNVGIMKNHALMIEVLRGKLSICGIPFTTKFTLAESAALQKRYAPKAGLISAHQLCQYTGFAYGSPAKLTAEQLNYGTLAYLNLMAKYLFCRVAYSKPVSIYKEQVRLFGLNICNTSMRGAVKKVMTAKHQNGRSQTFCFINAHSINQLARGPKLREALNQCDTLFADGSGMRVAAQKAGLRLQDNVNGTDMLPVLCEQAEIQGKRIFLLGAKPGVAEKMANNLIAKFPALEIAGTQHGYFNDDEVPEIIERINAQEANILLVAFGSPIQEAWLAEHAPHLNCDAILAVGGLFDFYSGNIARAPLAMRQMGLEWVWRLLQEPKTKFTRYVLGTPEFLFRTYFTNQVLRGI